MSSLSDIMNKVSRLVAPELRAEDERKRREAEIEACNSFLQKKRALETQLVRASQQQEKFSTAAAAATQELEKVEIAEIKAGFESVLSAAKTLERYVRDIAGSSSDTMAFSGFLRETEWAFKRANIMLGYQPGLSRSREYALSSLVREDFSEVERGMSTWGAQLAALRQTFAAGIAPASREGQKLFFKDEVVGYKTERRASYPLVFLTEKVQVPITKRVELSPNQKAACVNGYLDALDTFEKKIPQLLAQTKEIAMLVARVNAHEDAKRTVMAAQAQLDEIPADLEEKVQCHVAALNKPGLVLKSK